MQQGDSLASLLRDVRERIGVSRLAVFLPSPHPSGRPHPLNGGHRLPCAGAVGIPFEAGRSYRLSKQSGIGRWIIRHGRILQRTDAPSLLSADENAVVQEEFQSLKCDLAIPINDREGTVGVALVGEPITQVSLDEGELRMTCHFMEELGLFLKSFWRWERLNWENTIYNEVFSTVRCGILIVNADLEVLMANAAIREFLGYEGADSLEFAAVPGCLADQIRGAQEEMQASTSFFLSMPEDPKKRLFRVTLTPHVEEGGQHSPLLLVVMEDFSEVDAAKRDAIGLVTSRLSTQLELLGT